MTTQFTETEATESLSYAMKIIMMKGRLLEDYIRHDSQLNCLLENIEDTTIQALIDKYYGRVFDNDFFNEYGEQ